MPTSPASVRPALPGLLLALAAVLFGFGMVLAGGCASRTVVRVGAGSLKSFIVFIVMGLVGYMTARGLLYGALVEPRLPGPALVRGTLYGTLEYLVSPWGGLTALAGPGAPHRRIPLLASLFDDYQRSDDSFADHLVFGVALALLYGNVPRAAAERRQDEED